MAKMATLSDNSTDEDSTDSDSSIVFSKSAFQKKKVSFNPKVEIHVLYHYVFASRQGDLHQKIGMDATGSRSNEFHTAHKNRISTTA